MQGRMKQHGLSQSEITEILNNSEVGRIATNSPNGYPYIVPVHYIYLNEKSLYTWTYKRSKDRVSETRFEGWIRSG